MNDKKGECRMNTEIELNVNDYLDLYLFAGDLGETIWQLEIIEQLEALTTEKTHKKSTFRQGYSLEKIQTYQRRNLSHFISTSQKPLYKS